MQAQMEAMRLRRERCAASKRQASANTPTDAQLEQQQHLELLQNLMQKQLGGAASVSAAPAATRRQVALGLRRALLCVASLLSLVLPVRFLLAYSTPTAGNPTPAARAPAPLPQLAFRSGVRFTFRRLSYGKYQCEREPLAEAFAPCTQPRPNFLFLYSPVAPPAAPTGGAGPARAPLILHFHGGALPLHGVRQPPEAARGPLPVREAPSGA